MLAHDSIGLVFLYIDLKMKKILFFVALAVAFAACHNNAQKVDEVTPEEPIQYTVSDAIAMFTDSIAADSTNAILYLERAQALLASEQVGAAMIDINKSLQLDPNNVDTYLLLANVYYMLGDDSNISTTLNKAVEIAPYDSRPLVKLGELNLLQQNFNLRQPISKRH